MSKGKRAQPKLRPEESFEERLDRVEEIATSLSEGKLQLQEALAMYQEGMELVTALRKTLEESRVKVEKLNRLTGQLEQFDLGESPSS